MKLTAEFRDAEATAAAIQGLGAAGFEKKDMEVYSLKPVEFEPGVLDRPSHMSLFAVLGAMVACVVVTSFVFWAQQDYPLVTGGMPLTSMWATGVITFELTMAGAILTTMLMFIWEAGLLRPPKREPLAFSQEDPIFLEVRCSEAFEGRAHNLLRQHGAVNVEEQESR